PIFSAPHPPLPALYPLSLHDALPISAVVIVTLILLGRTLEARAKGRTSQAIKRLVGLQAKTARVERNGETVEIALDHVATGDVVDRKSTRLSSSHVKIAYAVFCLKKK